ncbi:MAG: hypothetical protein U9R32_04050, partial [Bacteroidota bacterium]|nr:hypothetical protein [Bacteroidota bacterium]
LMYNYSRQRIEDGHLLNIMKNHWKYLSLNMQNGNKLLKQIKKCSTIKDYNKIIRDWSFSE